MTSVMLKAQEGKDYEPCLLGIAEKIGFETRVDVKNYSGCIAAEAVDQIGHVFGRSQVHHIATSSYWDGIEVDTWIL